MTSSQFGFYFLKCHSEMHSTKFTQGVLPHVYIQENYFSVIPISPKLFRNTSTSENPQLVYSP